MRLLLDEMCSPTIAEHLRRRGHDVVAALERNELRSLSDEALLASADSERRAIATFDVGDFAQLDTRFRAEDREHYGIVLIPARAFSTSAHGIGALAGALAAALEAHPDDDALVNARLWLVADR